MSSLQAIQLCTQNYGIYSPTTCVGSRSRTNCSISFLLERGCVVIASPSAMMSNILAFSHQYNEWPRPMSPRPLFVGLAPRRSTCTRTRTYTYVHTYVRVHVRTRTYTRTYVRTYVHAVRRGAARPTNGRP